MQGDNKTYAEIRHTNAVKNQMSTRRAFGASVCVECNVCVEEKREPKIKSKATTTSNCKGNGNSKCGKGRETKNRQDSKRIKAKNPQQGASVSPTSPFERH